MGVLPTIAILVLIIAAAAVLATAPASAEGRRGRPARHVVARLHRRRVILGQGELRAHGTLRGLPGYMVLAKVPLARFLKVPRRHCTRVAAPAGHQCADLVVCDMASAVLAVVSVRPSASRGERARQAPPAWRGC